MLHPMNAPRGQTTVTPVRNWNSKSTIGTRALCQSLRNAFYWNCNERKSKRILKHSDMHNYQRKADFYQIKVRQPMKALERTCLLINHQRIYQIDVCKSITASQLAYVRKFFNGYDNAADMLAWAVSYFNPLTDFGLMENWNLLLRTSIAKISHNYDTLMSDTINHIINLVIIIQAVHICQCANGRFIKSFTMQVSTMYLHASVKLCNAIWCEGTGQFLWNESIFDYLQNNENINN